MNETIIKRLGNLLSVKSLVTLALTVVFAVMAVRQAISQDFMTIYAVIIAFYFGTQSQKAQDVIDSATDTSSVRAEFNRAQPLREAPQSGAYSSERVSGPPTDGAVARSVDGGGNG